MFMANIALRDVFDQEIHSVKPVSNIKNQPSSHAITVAMKNLDSKPTTTKVFYL